MWNTQGHDRQPETLVAERTGQLSERLRELERHHQALRAAGIASWEWNLAMDQLYWSEEIAPMFGFEPGEFDKSYQAFLDCVHPDDRQSVSDALNTSIEHSLDIDVEFRIVWPNGTVRWLAATGGVIEYPDGSERRLVGILRDVTKRKWTEGQLRDSHEEYRTLVENISDAIYATDREGTITYISPVIETFLGYTTDEIIGQPLVQFFVPEDIQRVKADFDRLIAGVQGSPNEYRVVNADGERRWLRVSGQPIHNRDYVTGIQGVLTDITERKLYETQREKAVIVEERQRLARELHDSVTQSLYTTTLIAEALPLVWERQPVEARQSLEELRQLTHGALAEMRALLVELRPEALLDRPLSDLLDQLIAGMNARSEPPITLTISDERTLPAEVQWALYRIAQEALNNVHKHSQANHVWVSLRYRPGKVMLRVKDDGLGFDPDGIPAGTLGLKSMSERAQSINARLSVASRPGQGAEVIVEWEEEDE